jgi:hypothetical protein
MRYRFRFAFFEPLLREIHAQAQTRMAHSAAVFSSKLFPRFAQSVFQRESGGQIRVRVNSWLRLPSK